MIQISDAIPVQFWLNGLQTFNQKIEPGVDKICFHQKFNADDDIKLQFTDTAETNYSLTIYDEDDEEIDELDFDRTEVDGVFVYSLDFTMESVGVTNHYVRLEIVTYSNNLTGSVEESIEEVSGELEVFPASNSGFIAWLDSPDLTGCGDAEIAEVYFLGASIVPGTILYEDAARTILASGHNYVSVADAGGLTYEIDFATAEVGVSTGFNCLA